MISGNDRVLTVGLGQVRFGAPGEQGVLAIYGLGSCVGLSLFDPNTGVGALGHIVLPGGEGVDLPETPAKFANRAIPWMVRRLEDMGARVNRLEAKMAGGANMFSANGVTNIFSIGERNAAVARQLLGEMGIKVAGCDIGGRQGRSVFFQPADGVFLVRTLGQKRVL